MVTLLVEQNYGTEMATHSTNTDHSLTAEPQPDEMTQGWPWGWTEKGLLEGYGGDYQLDYALVLTLEIVVGSQLTRESLLG